MQASGQGRQNPAGPYFAKRGYVFALGHIRGAHESEGSYYLHVNDGEDGAVVADWLAGI